MSGQLQAQWRGVARVSGNYAAAAALLANGAVAAGLDRLFDEGVNAVAILRAAQRHFQDRKCHTLRVANCDNGSG